MKYTTWWISWLTYGSQEYSINYFERIYRYAAYYFSVWTETLQIYPENFQDYGDSWIFFNLACFKQVADAKEPQNFKK